MSEKAVVITIDIAAKATGKRKVVVSGAPAGEMPVVKTGVFADLHTLISQVWMELLQREPQVPVDNKPVAPPAPKKKPAAATKPGPDANAAAATPEPAEEIVPADDDAVADTTTREAQS